MPINPTNHLIARNIKKEPKQKSFIDKVHHGLKTVEKYANKAKRIVSIINE